MSEILLVNKSDVVAIADAARAKAGIDDKLTLSGIVNTIDSIGAGIDTSDATAAAEDIMSGKTAYVNGEKITGSYVPAPAVKTSKTVYLNFDNDEEYIGEAVFFENGVLRMVHSWDGFYDVEVDGGVVHAACTGLTYEGNYETLFSDGGNNNVVMFFEDGGTIYFYSSSEQ